MQKLVTPFLIVILASTITLSLAISGSSSIASKEPEENAYTNYKTSLSLPVKFDKQDRRLSCEVAVLKMILAYHGIQVDEKKLIEKMGFDPAPKKRVNGELIWGDPQKGFVGNIDGKMLVNGYGVYWKPIAHVANDFRKAEWFQQWNTQDLVKHLNKNHPIMIWGYLGPGTPTYWKTAEGKNVYAVYYEHTFVVRGYKGDPKNPEGFYLMDPIYGEKYLNKNAFLKMWNAFGRSGVIVL